MGRFQDSKYGPLELPMTPAGEDEPVFILRGHDALAAPAIDAYAAILEAAALTYLVIEDYYCFQPLADYAAAATERANQFREWQAAHKVHLPD